MGAPGDAAWLTATAAAGHLRSGGLTPAALVQACLDRIAEADAELEAWAHVDADGARAAVTGRGGLPGPLHGVPFGVKDIFDVAGLPTTHGVERYAGNVPARDAAAVARIRAAGGIVLGKTVTTEFALFHPGPTRNPHDPEHTPGGSSSGSAAAVAAGMVPLALGTQTAGSVIRPAAFCGVVGYKPSLGWVSRAGCLAVCDTLDTVGMFARTVDDAALLGGVLTGRDLGAGRDAGGPPTLGLCRTPLWDRLDADARAAVEAAAEAAGARGAHLVELEPVDDYEGVLEAHGVVMAYEAARELAFEWSTAAGALSPELRELLTRGEATPAADYDAALAVAEAARAQAAERLTGVDATLTPSALGGAPRGLSSTGDPVCNRVWTLLGVPCLHLPFARTDGGLPLGVQLVAGRGSDRALLQAGRWVAGALGADVAPRPPAPGSG